MKASSPKQEIAAGGEVLSQKWQDASATLEEQIRQSPLAAIGCAAFAGYLINVFPVGRLLGALCRLILALIKPALLIFGTLKVIECFKKPET